MKNFVESSNSKSNFTMSIGIVKNNADPAEDGRLQIYIPSIDSKSYDLEDLTWATYVSPFGGTVANLKVGREKTEIPGMSSYGFWAIPKIGAQVICGFLESDPSSRFWFGCIYVPEANRTMPYFIDGEKTELDDSGMYPQNIVSNLSKNQEKAGLGKGSKHFKTRGGYERSISHPSNKNRNKPSDNGYAPKSNDPKSADSQMICLSSPGKHYILFSDIDEYSRIRIRTFEGNQIIFDDTNERIYISTAKGKNWVELDEGNGKVYVYSDSKINIRGKNDINLYSDENINIVANKRVNIQSESRSVNLEGKHDIRLKSSGGDIMLNASRDISLKTVNGPIASSVGEEQFCDPERGLIYRWSEKGGSSSSMIKIDGIDGIEISSKGALNLGSKGGLSVRSAGSSPIMIQSGGDLHFNIGGSSHTNPTKGTKSPASATMADHVSTNVESLDVVSHMIKPDHESWDRDEDESICPTPRNPSYQG